MTHSLVAKLCTLKEKLDALRQEFEDVQSELNECTDFPSNDHTDNAVLADMCGEIAASLEEHYDTLEEALTPDDESEGKQIYTVHMWNDEDEDTNDYEEIEVEADSPEEAEKVASEQYNFDHYKAQDYQD